MSRPDREPDRSLVETTLVTLVTDRLMQLVLFMYAAFAFVYVVPVVPASWRALVTTEPYADVAFLVATIAAFQWRARSLERTEKRFWNALTAALFFWLLGTLALSSPFGPPLFKSLAEEISFALYYVAFAFALERRPHLRSRAPKVPTLSLPVFAIFVLGLFLYFVIVPVIENRSLFESTLPSTYLFLVLDAFLAVKLFELAVKAESPRWKAQYLLLAVVTCMFFYNDLFNVPFYAMNLPRTWTLSDTLLWNAQFVLLALAARLRRRQVPAEPAAAAAGRGLVDEAREQTLTVALLFPFIHSAAYTFGLLDEPSQEARDALMLVWLLLIGTVALIQHRWLEKSFSRLEVRGFLMDAENRWRRRIQAAREDFIARLQKKQQEIEARNAEMAAFNYAISHDLRNPLVTILSFSGLLEKEIAAADIPRAERIVDQITAAAEHLKRLLEEVLELSHIGRLPARRERISPGEIVRQALARLADELTRRGVRVEVAPDLPGLEGDRTRLAGVFEKLIDNAVKFMGDQGEPLIRIGCRRQDGRSVFYVRDNGLGVEAGYHEKIFGLFERLDHGSEGTGIGLALAKRVVEAHGGRLWVESAGRGKGSTFCFFIPPSEPRER